jgi:hypothetical protein
VACDLLQQPEELNKVLPELSTGQQRMAVQLGAAIARFEERPRDWERPIRDAFAAASVKGNFGVVAGYYKGLAARDPRFFAPKAALKLPRLTTTCLASLLVQPGKQLWPKSDRPIRRLLAVFL